MVVAVSSRFMEEVGGPLPAILLHGPGKNPRRHNPYSKQFAPPGYCYCSHPACTQLVAVRDEDYFVCPDEHFTDLKEEDRKRSKPGGWTHSGLSPTALGRLGEEILLKLGDLGELGVIDKSRWIPEQRKPLDGFTNLGHGIENKTSDVVCAARAFDPGRELDRARKVRFAEQQGAELIIGTYVMVDLATSLAKVYVRSWRGEIQYYTVNEYDEPFAVVDFTDLNPFVVEGEEREKTEIPF